MLRSRSRLDEADRRTSSHAWVGTLDGFARLADLSFVHDGVKSSVTCWSDDGPNHLLAALYEKACRTLAPQRIVDFGALSARIPDSW